MDNDDKPLYDRIIDWILIIVFGSIILLPEIGQWAIIAGMICDFFDIDYSKYDHLVPFVFMSDGENVSVLIAVGLIIVILLVLAFICGGDDVKVYIFLLEIFALVLAGYIIICVAAAHMILKISGFALSKWISLIIVIAIHIIFFMIAKIAIHIHREFTLPRS
jgi:hypothetical protein